MVSLYITFVTLIFTIQNTIYKGKYDIYMSRLSNKIICTATVLI